MEFVVVYNSINNEPWHTQYILSMPWMSNVLLASYKI